MILASFAVGMLIHVALMVRPSEMLADRPFRDDGFYGLTVSRNLALGKGLSVSDGEIATNGIQPVFVYLCSLLYLVTPDRYEALRLVHGLHLIVHLLGAVSVFSLVRSLTGGRRAAWIAAALWACSYNVMKESSNALETGLYLLMLMLASMLYLRIAAGVRTGFPAKVFFGVFLGLVTLTRIDSGLFVVALAVHYVFIAKPVEEMAAGRRVIRRFASGPLLWAAGWTLATLPWWLYNIGLTGNPLPISGLVQTMGHTTDPSILFSEILTNLWYAAHVTLDNLTFILWVPLRAIYFVTVRSVALLAVKAFALAVFVFIAARNIKGGEFRKMLPWRDLSFFPLFLLGLLLFYVFYFNVEWYMNRYLIPVSIAAVVVLSSVLDRLRDRYTIIVLAGGILFNLAVSVSTYSVSYNPMYLYHWGWVRDNVSDETWVGASQSGTLGYFHDRTVNTDGKVNTEIFGLPEGQFGRYLESRGVSYFLEWEETFIFRDSSFLDRYEYLYDFGTNQVWRLKSLSGALDNES
ncbi:MAG: hypothetical protein R6V62_07735 [Candidatus Fermentibacteraceae bacterium]